MEIKSKRLHLHTNQGLNTMKEIKLEINIEARKYNELTEEDRKLVDAACKATQRSYAPYSHFSVGAAALLENGVVVTGSNQENAAYPSGLCAERTTLFYANSQYPDQAVKHLPLLHEPNKTSLTLPSHPVVPADKCCWKLKSGLENQCVSYFTANRIFISWKV